MSPKVHIEKASKEELNSYRIQDALYGFTRSQMMFSAIELDLFTAISDGNKLVETLENRLNVDKRALKIFLDGLVGIGFLEKDGDGRYQNPPDVEQFLVKKSPDYIGGMVNHCKRLKQNWSGLTAVSYTHLTLPTR